MTTEQAIQEAIEHLGCSPYLQRLIGIIRKLEKEKQKSQVEYYNEIKPFNWPKF